MTILEQGGRYSSKVYCSREGRKERLVYDAGRVSCPPAQRPLLSGERTLFRRHPPDMLVQSMLKAVRRFAYAM